MAIKQVPSPNYTKGRTQPISKLTIHWMVGTLASTDTHFKNPNSGVSAHYGIENTKIHQYVKESDTAWHAMSANPFSIGIENSAAPGRPASNLTYTTLIDLCTDICKRYKLNPETAIEPHSKYVATQCPGTIDLNRIKKGVKDKLKGEPMIDKKTHNALYWGMLNRAPSAEEVKRDVGKKTASAMITELYNFSKKNKRDFNSVVKAKNAEIAELKKGATVLKKGRYVVE